MKTRIPATFLKALKAALCTAACFSPAAHTATFTHGFEDCRVATADELGEMRGGFDFNAGGLHLSFSIEKVTFINGALVATTSLNIPSLNSLGNPQTIADNNNLQAAIANLQKAAGRGYNPVTTVQNGPKNTFTLPDGLNLSTSALTTVIQNTLDNQVIRNMTILNATLNSQALIRAMAISSSLNQALNSSVR